MFKYLIETVFMTKEKEEEYVTPTEPKDNYLVEVFTCEPASIQKEWRRNSNNRLESVMKKS